MDPGVFPPQCGLPDEGYATAAQGIGSIGTPSSVRCYVGRGYILSVDVRPLPPEHHFPIYRDLSDIEAASGGALVSSSVGHMEIVVTGRPMLG